MIWPWQTTFNKSAGLTAVLIGGENELNCTRVLVWQATDPVLQLIFMDRWTGGNMTYMMYCDGHVYIGFSPLIPGAIAHTLSLAMLRLQHSC